MTGGTALLTRATAYQALADALAACESVNENSPQRQALMTAIWSTVCTQKSRTVVPMGSVRPVAISSDYASVELVAVMDWLALHEAEARAHTPDGLFRAMRAVGTLGMNGSGRAVQSDRLCGLVDVPAGVPVRLVEVDDEGRYPT